MPDNMTVRYLLDGNDTLLGTETYQSITEITLPLPDDGGHKITLTRFFSGQTSHRWLVERVQHSDEQVDLFLTLEPNVPMKYSWQKPILLSGPLQPVLLKVHWLKLSMDLSSQPNV